MVAIPTSRVARLFEVEEVGSIVVGEVGTSVNTPAALRPADGRAVVGGGRAGGDRAGGFRFAAGIVHVHDSRGSLCGERANAGGG